MQEFLIECLKNQFTWGLLLGLLITAFVYKSGFSAKRQIRRELKRVRTEMTELQNHLNTQLKINATGNQALQGELAILKEQNETLRVNNAALQQKPEKAGQRQLEIYENAIRTLREQAPGFAPAWERALRQAEEDAEAASSGLRRLVRRVIPGLTNSTKSEPAPDDSSIEG
ncbi:MAG: hypothetical protein ACQCXQ_07700, partial [Verrucomicrobiales bacterium]|nr:hypothetical protein [Verrucomicrobiota bacterium JB025]